MTEHHATSTRPIYSVQPSMRVDTGRWQSSEMKSGKGNWKVPSFTGTNCMDRCPRLKKARDACELETSGNMKTGTEPINLLQPEANGSDTIETSIYMPTNTERRAHPPRHHDSIRREHQMLSLPHRFPPLSGGYALHFANGAAPFVVKSIRQRWIRELAGHKQESVLRQQNLEAP